MKASSLLGLVAAAVLASTAAPAATIATVFYDNRFGTVDSSTGAYTQISTLPVNKAAGIAVDKGIYYVEDLADNLLAVNPVTGAAQVLGNTGQNLDFVVFAGGNQGLYGIDYQSNLYSFNPKNGAATLVGPTGLAPNNGYDDTSLSFDGSSLLYTAGPAGHVDQLYRINIATGLATSLGATGVTAIAGSAFFNGNLDLFQYGQSTNYIYSASDGSTDFIRDTVLRTQIVDGGVAEQPMTPEPEYLGLAAPLLLAIAFFFRRVRRQTAQGE